MLSIIRLPGSLQRRIDAATRALLRKENGLKIDFSRPLREEALISPNSVSWRVFKNPIALFVGGVTAVILELAESAVRTGVWEHSSFASDPAGRLQRTGLAAMVTVYGARSIAEPMIAQIARRHAQVVGTTPKGVPYCASDPRLLTWVHATAAFAFVNAYSRYVESLSDAEMDAFYREAAPAAKLYGALGAPLSCAEVSTLFDSMRGALEPSPIVFQFLKIMRGAAALPRPLFRMQPLLVRAAVELVPHWVRQCLGLDPSYGLRTHEQWFVRFAGNMTDRIVLSEAPAAQSCVRLGLPSNHLYA